MKASSTSLPENAFEHEGGEDSIKEHPAYLFSAKTMAM